MCVERERAIKMHKCKYIDCLLFFHFSNRCFGAIAQAATALKEHTCSVVINMVIIIAALSNHNDPWLSNN